MSSGKLKVCLRNAVLQEDATISEKRTLFCIVKVDSQEFSTLAEGGKILSFLNRRFEFQVDHNMEHPTVDIFIKKNLEDNDFLVYCSINFALLLYKFSSKLKLGKRNVYPRPVFQMACTSIQERGLVNFHVTYKADVHTTYARAVEEVANRYAETLSHVPSLNRFTNEEDSSSGDDSDSDTHRRRNSICRPQQSPRGGAPVNRTFVASSGNAQLPAALGYDKFPAGSGYARLPYIEIPKEDQDLHELSVNNNSLLEINVVGTSIQDVPVGSVLKPDEEVSEELIEQSETSSYGSAPEELSDYEEGSSGALPEAGYYSDGKGGWLINFQ